MRRPHLSHHRAMRQPHLCDRCVVRGELAECLGEFARRLPEPSGPSGVLPSAWVRAAQRTRPHP